LITRSDLITGQPDGLLGPIWRTLAPHVTAPDERRHLFRQ
jgi:hypothetical protein